jgi:hypothetical protein
MPDELLWAYGVVPAGQPAPAVPGVEGRPVEGVQRDDLVVLLSRVPAERFSREALHERLEDLDTLEALARAHDGVLEAALEAGDVVPLRLATLYASADAVRDLLAEEGERFARALRRVHRKAEWGVKAFAVPRPKDAEARPSSGAEYLARRRAERDRAASQDDELTETLARIHASLADRADAAVLTRPQDRRLSGREEEMVLNGSYLVGRDDGPEFAALVRRLGDRGAQAGVALELTGPWPAYHFAGEAEA